MIHRLLLSLRILALLGALGSLGYVSVDGQTRATVTRAEKWAPPLTRDGVPNLEGVWVNNSATPLERPPELAGKPTLTQEEVATLQARADRLFENGNSDFPQTDDVFLSALRNVERYENPRGTASSYFHARRIFENRTSLIVDPPDGKVPPLTPDAAARQAALTAARSQPAEPQDLDNTLRCITWGVPRLGAGSPYAMYYGIVQAADHIVLRLQTDVRIIPLDGRPHLGQRLRQWNGDSRGWWEGYTLVVDTTNFSSKSDFRGAVENLHLIERFTRVAPDMIKYEFTVEDQTTWTRPWTVEVRLRRSEEQIYEFACHEGNYSMRGILAGARSEQKSVAGASPR
jgi:hypothetical protein